MAHGKQPKPYVITGNEGQVVWDTGVFLPIELFE